MKDSGREQLGTGGRSASSTPASRSPVLEVRNVSKWFGDTVAVDDVTFDVHDGEFLFLIGPSGCGKTTTLRMIGGYERATSGEIAIRGRVVNDVPLEKRNIGMVFQSYALFPHMTVTRNVEYGLRMRRVSSSERNERVREVLDLVELSDLGERYPAQLSGGQRQRVALGRVIAYQPDILLLDEPLANLDKRLRDVMRVELKKLQEKVGITTVYVTHDQEEALTMADRLVVMEGGRMLQIGSPKELYNSPSTTFVATFLGETSSFRGAVESDVDGIAHVVMDDGFRATFRHREDVSVGDRVMVSIRPEAVTITTEPPEGKENVVSGVVDFASYLGSHVVYMIRIDNGSALVRASEPIPSGEARFAQGDRVFASWDIDHVVYVRD